MWQVHNVCMFWGASQSSKAATTWSRVNPYLDSDKAYKASRICWTSLCGVCFTCLLACMSLEWVLTCGLRSFYIESLQEFRLRTVPRIAFFWYNCVAAKDFLMDGICSWFYHSIYFWSRVLCFFFRRQQRSTALRPCLRLFSWRMEMRFIGSAAPMSRNWRKWSKSINKALE